MKNLFQLNLNSQNRIFGLDLLRAIAILFVMILHAGRFLPFPEKYHPYYVKIIYDGVGIFFVLSGFLIGGILIREVEQKKFNFRSLTQFWKKRWSRTLPNYFLFVIVLMPLYSASVMDTIQHLFFVQNIYHQPIGSPIEWSWSLSVEEWFYLSIPFLVFLGIFFLKIQPKTVFLGIILTLLFLIIGLRYFSYFNQNLWGGIKFDDIRYSVIFRMDGIMYGVLGAYLHHYHLSFWERYKWYFFAVGCVGIGLFYLTKIEQNEFYRWVFSFSVNSIAVFCLLPVLSLYKTEKNNFFRNTILHISLISYSLYLVNIPVSDFLVYVIPWDYIVSNFLSSWALAKLINHILFWGISILLATLIYKYYEVPTINYFRKK